MSQVIGGLQRLKAIRNINDSHADTRITTRKCAVYGNDLSFEAKLYLAEQHNEFNQIQRETTFPEVAALCRKIAFHQFWQWEPETDSEIEYPYTSTADYKKFKEECETILTGGNVVSQYITGTMLCTLLLAHA